MALVRNVLVELGVATLLLGCYTQAESCVGEGTPCKKIESAGCTRRAVCDNDTEIDMEEDEEARCRQCQKPCSEKIYIMYSSREDITPASGWYTYHQQINWFTRIVNIPDHHIMFNLKKDWILNEWKDGQRRRITDRIELKYKNDKRTKIALHNFGIGENEMKSLNVYTEPKQTRDKYGTPYAEKLVIFCPGKCLCKEFEVKSLYNYCFEGIYKRIDKHANAVQSKQELSTDKQESSTDKQESSTDIKIIRSKRSYRTRSKAKRSYALDFSDFIANSIPNFNLDQLDFSFTANTKQNDEPMSMDTSKKIQNEFSFTANTRQNDEPTTMDTSKKTQKKFLHHDSIKSQPNNKSTSKITSNDEQRQNWQQETYKSTSEDSNDTPFYFTYDEDYQVWFIGKGDDISAVIPEASPCPEIIQKQPWLVVEKDLQLKLGNFNISITCRQRG